MEREEKIKKIHELINVIIEEASDEDVESMYNQFKSIAIVIKAAKELDEDQDTK